MRRPACRANRRYKTFARRPGRSSRDSPESSACPLLSNRSVANPRPVMHVAAGTGGTFESITNTKACFTPRGSDNSTVSDPSLCGVRIGNRIFGKTASGIQRGMRRTRRRLPALRIRSRQRIRPARHIREPHQVKALRPTRRNAHQRTERTRPPAPSADTPAARHKTAPRRPETRPTISDCSQTAAASDKNSRPGQLQLGGPIPNPSAPPITVCCPGSANQELIARRPKRKPPTRMSARIFRTRDAVQRLWGI